MRTDARTVEQSIRFCRTGLRLLTTCKHVIPGEAQRAWPLNGYRTNNTFHEEISMRSRWIWVLLVSGMFELPIGLQAERASRLRPPSDWTGT